VTNSIVTLDQDSGLVPNPPDRLSRKQRTVIAYIEHNPKFAAFATTAELGARTGVHPSTIVRLSQLLGFPGFPEFQEALRHRYLNPPAPPSIATRCARSRPSSSRRARS
jgi:DNA-binding MurR/RpiR family transcriptional regulator